jgi:hypothetical protein
VKTTKSILTSLILGLLILGQYAMPANAATPTFDITGNWKSNSTGETFTVFQEKDEVNVIYINGGFAHRFSGRYVSPTKVKFILIRRTRSNNCEVTMESEFNLTSATTMKTNSTPSETGCGIAVGQNFPDTATKLP